jgi:DNA ligase 1
MITPILFPESEHKHSCGAKMEYLPHTGWLCTECEEKTESVANEKAVRFDELFRIDSKGKMRVWQIGVDRASGDSFTVITTSGLVDGKKVSTNYIVSEGKNIGRTNETTPYEQACFEAKARHEAQIRSGYADKKENATQDTLGSGIPAPMLAKIYSPGGDVKNSKTLEQMKIAGQMIHVQPKFDGNRCLIRVGQDKVEMFTRKGDRMLPVPHIESQIRWSYDNAFTSGEEYILDGELYTDQFTFNALNGLLRREDKTEEHLEMLKQVNFQIYDVMSDLNYAKRYFIIRYFATTPNVKLVPSVEVVADDKFIRHQMEQFLAQGYEGLMIRRLDLPYENKRSWGLCKYKDFQDAEYKVTDIIEDARGGIIGAFECEMTDGRTFRAGIKNLTNAESAKMLKNKDQYIGRMATVEFFALSEYQIPRFPKLKGFRADV